MNAQQIIEKYTVRINGMKRMLNSLQQDINATNSNNRNYASMIESRDSFEASIAIIQEVLDDLAKM